MDHPKKKAHMKKKSKKFPPWLQKGDDKDPKKKAPAKKKAAAKKKATKKKK